MKSNIKNVRKHRCSQAVEVHRRANLHFYAIANQITQIQTISNNLVDGANGSEEINWSHVGSLAHLRDSLADILEGWEDSGYETYRAE
jgi:hypothetical protein